MQAEAATASKTAKNTPAKAKAKAAPQAAPLPAITIGQIVMAPFSVLDNCKELNVRKKPSTPESISELAALIKAHTLLKNLVGFMRLENGQPTGRIAVVAGGRRMAALALLHSRGDIADDYPVPVKIVSEEDAVSVSLAENSHERMHPADEYEAMRMLIDQQGRSIEDVAAAFGVTAAVVRARLKLAKVSPRLLDEFRADQIDLSQMMALALSDDHAQQETIWFNSQHWQRQPNELRRKITQNEASIKHDPLARFVGLEAYEAAGGPVRRDLFSESSEVFMQDLALLNSLAADKLKAIAAPIEAEGWKWIEVRAEVLDYSERHRYDKAKTKKREATPEEQAQIEAINAKISELDTKLDAAYEQGDTGSDDDEGNDEAAEHGDAIEAMEQELSTLHDQIEVIEEGMQVFTKTAYKTAGVIISVENNGTVRIDRGLIRPEDKAATKKAAQDASGEGGEEGSESTNTAKPIHSERLTKELTAHRTAALQASIAARPDVALVVLTHRLASRVFGNHCYMPSVCQISIEQTYLKAHAPTIETFRAAQELEAMREKWERRIPESREELFAWLLTLPTADVLELLALCTAYSVNTVQGREAEDALTTAIAQAVSLDMSQYWKATTETYFAHVPKHRIAEVVKEAVSEDAATPLHSMKKGDAAATAEKAIEGKGWIPELFRFA